MDKLNSIADSLIIDKLMFEYSFNPKDDEFGSLCNSNKLGSFPRELMLLTSLANTIASKFYNAELKDNGTCNVSHTKQIPISNPELTVETLSRDCYYLFSKDPNVKVEDYSNLTVIVGITNNKAINITTLNIDIMAYGGRGIILNRYEELDKVLRRRITSRKWMPTKKVYRNEAKLEKYIIENIKNALDSYTILPG